MIIIPSADQPDLFALNVFRVRPESQQAMVDCIREAGDPDDIPGLLSMYLLCSRDGTHVINFMHWAGKEGLKADNPVIETTKAAIRQFIEGDGPLPYKVVEVKARG